MNKFINYLSPDQSSCPISESNELDTRDYIPSVYKDVLKYFMESVNGSYYEIVGTFNISNTLYFSDIDVNLYSVINSLEHLYKSLSSLGDTGDTGYIYSDLKINNEHYDKNDIKSDIFRDIIMSLSGPTLIKHDVIFFDNNIYREASFFLLFRNDSNLTYLNTNRDVITSLKESFLEEINQKNYMKAIKRLLSLSKATGNKTYIGKLLYYIDSKYNMFSMIISGIDCLRIVRFYIGGDEDDIENCINNLMYLYETLNIKEIITTSSLNSSLRSVSEDMYLSVIYDLKNALNNDLSNNLQCKKMNLMNIYNTM